MIIAALIIAVPLWIAALALRDLYNQIKKQDDNS
jgi:hypothetical protein